MNLLYIVIAQILVELSDAKHIEQKFTKEPDSIIVKEGDNVTLDCSVNNKVGVLQWTKDGFGLGTSRSLSGYERYKIIGEEGKT